MRKLLLLIFPAGNCVRSADNPRRYASRTSTNRVRPLWRQRNLRRRLRRWPLLPAQPQATNTQAGINNGRASAAPERSAGNGQGA